VDAGDDPVMRPTPPLLLPGGLALLAGLYAGLARIGWTLPPPAASLAAVHGPLMVAGFLGTLIGLERAVALAQGLDRAGGAQTPATSGRAPSGAAALGAASGFLYPALSGIGALALMGGLGGPWAPMLIAAASGGLVGLSAAITRRQPALHHAALTLGALSWLAGNALWLAGWPVYRVVAWWIAFLVLTIAGERLELSRVLRPSHASRVSFGAVAFLLLAGVTLGVWMPAAGARLAGLALVAVAAWLFQYDVARRTIRQGGLTRFIAAAMLSGYAWLAAGGVLFAVLGGRLVAGPPYDAALHAVFVGFVFSMIFGHAPVILPAVLRVAVPYRAWFYAHLLLLHLSLALRVGGDLLGWWGVRRWGGLLGAAAILLFLALTAASAIAAWSAARRHVREPVRPETSPPLAARGPTLIAEGQPR
jgi:hypothetical protein